MQPTSPEPRPPTAIDRASGSVSDIWPSGVQALVQGRKPDACSVARVSAEEIEQAILKALRADRALEPGSADRDLIDQHVGRADLRRDCIAISMTATTLAEGAAEAEVEVRPTLTVSFAPVAHPRKGLKHTPDHVEALNDADRIALLTTIARSKSWIDELLRDPLLDFAAIAHREKLAERHVRFLSPSPTSRCASSKPSPTVARRPGSLSVASPADSR